MILKWQIQSYDIKLVNFCFKLEIKKLQKLTTTKSIGNGNGSLSLNFSFMNFLDKNMKAIVIIDITNAAMFVLCMIVNISISVYIMFLKKGKGKKYKTYFS
jgi:hypothetical protein